MNKKLKYLTKISLNKKIKTKWFLIANTIFLILIIGLINIDSIIKLFGGSFDETIQIYVLNNSNYDIDSKFEETLSIYNNYLEIDSKYNKVIDKEAGYEYLKQDENNNSILIIVDDSTNNYMKAKIISNQNIDSTIYQTISNTLDTIKKEYALSQYGIDNEIMYQINQSVEIERIKLDKNAESEDENIIMGIIFPIITLPLFMLTMFLIQMIGAEINEEKSTKSMEIIISNVSAKTHFLSKLLSGNLFVLIQGILLIAYAIFAVLIRFITTKSFDISGITGIDGVNIIETLNNTGITNNLIYILPLTITLIILTFVGYSLLSAITASMTTNMEDYQQVQTPIVLISLIGYYLSMMASLFEGSIFIRIFSYLPFISTMLSPALLLLNQITIIDVIISIIIMILTIHILIKYGLRIYKVGILNYSNTNIWKKILSSVKEK